jgi:hypothetical protein
MIGIERKNIEGLIARGLTNLKRAEHELCERYTKLRNAPWEARVAFLNSLWELDRRAASLERLIEKRS